MNTNFLQLTICFECASKVRPHEGLPVQRGCPSFGECMVCNDPEIKVCTIAGWGLTVEEVKAQLFRHMLEVRRLGYHGMVPGGQLVDRRYVCDAHPVPRNELLGVPEPAEIPEGYRVRWEKRKRVAP